MSAENAPDAVPIVRPVLLTAGHLVSGFDCGVTALNDFLIKHALQNQGNGSARTYVATQGAQVVGYYSLTPGSVAYDEPPSRIAKGLPRHPVPVILMARFAVDKRLQGQGVGRSLFQDALLRALEGTEVTGGRAFLVHAKDDSARTFYERFGMEPSPMQPLHLYLLFKDVRKNLAR